MQPVQFVCKWFILFPMLFVMSCIIDGPVTAYKAWRNGTFWEGA